MHRVIWLTLMAWLMGMCCLMRLASAHPGSGIVVNSNGDVFFTDTGHGVWRIDSAGKLSHAYPSTGYHWLALDSTGSFSNADLRHLFAQHLAPNFERLTAAGVTPTLIAADGQPFVIGPDGNLYYAAGNLEVMRLTRDGKISPLVPGMAHQADMLGGIKGMACGPDGALYVAYPAAIQRITLEGKTTMLINPLKVDGCTDDVDPAMARPYLRGLAIGEDGTIYAAATNCRRVLKIGADRKVTSLLQCEAPWTPTGVAVTRGLVYLLEYDDPMSSTGRSLPRVRTIGRDGTVRTLAQVTDRLSPR